MGNRVWNLPPSSGNSYPIAGSDPTSRFAVLDTYRFIAAIGIVLYHFEQQFEPELGGKSNLFYSFHMTVDFFFVLSGFVLMHTYGAKLHSATDIGRFIQKRLARIYPLHFVTTLAFVALAVLVHHLNIAVNNPHIFDTSLLLPHLLLIHSWGATGHLGLDYPSWSISAEFFVYLLFPLFVALIFRAKPLGTLIIALGLVALITATRTKLGMTTFLHSTYDFGNFRAVPSFLAGMAMEVLVSAAQAQKTQTRLRYGLSIPWLTAHGFAAIILICMLVHASELLIFMMFPICVALIALAERSEAPTFLARPFFVQLGACSFGIYLLHPFVAIVIALVLRRSGWTSLPYLVLGITIGIILTTLLAAASFHWFETPVRKLLSRPLFAGQSPRVQEKPSP